MSLAVFYHDIDQPLKPFDIKREVDSGGRVYHVLSLNSAYDLSIFISPERLVELGEAIAQATAPSLCMEEPATAVDACQHLNLRAKEYDFGTDDTGYHDAGVRYTCECGEVFDAAEVERMRKVEVS